MQIKVSLLLLIGCVGPTWKPLAPGFLQNLLLSSFVPVLSPQRHLLFFSGNNPSRVRYHPVTPIKSSAPPFSPETKTQTRTCHIGTLVTCLLLSCPEWTPPPPAFLVAASSIWNYLPRPWVFVKKTPADSLSASWGGPCSVAASIYHSICWH